MNEKNKTIILQAASLLAIYVAGYVANSDNAIAVIVLAIIGVLISPLKLPGDNKKCQKKK